jgi:hypothetical protein
MEYDIMPGRSSENAKKAIDLAVERGFPAESVLTSRDGYHIPVHPDHEGADVIKTEPGTEDNPPVEIVGETAPDDEDESKAEDPKAEETKPAPKTARKRTAKKE